MYPPTIGVGMEGTTNLWTFMDVGTNNDDEQKLTDCLNVVEGLVPHHFDRIDDLHISILPGVELPKASFNDVSADLNDDMEILDGSDVEVTGISFFPQEDPHVVMLDVEIPNLKQVRKAQTETLSEYDNTELLYDPVDAHITLAKADDGEHSDVDGLSKQTQQNIVTAIGDCEMTVTSSTELREW